MREAVISARIAAGRNAINRRARSGRHLRVRYPVRFGFIDKIGQLTATEG